MHRLAIVTLLAIAGPLRAQDAPIYLWYEPEWFSGVDGSFAYWTGTAKPTGRWGVAGPGISAEWTQGGESEWNSMGAAAEETKAECGRDIFIHRSGKYRIWVRYVDHRKKTEPFRVVLEGKGKELFSGELGVTPIVPPGDEYQLFWGFSFGWGALDVELKAAGPMRLKLVIDRAGEGWRQVDAVLITDDLKHVPEGREKPAFAYQASFGLEPDKEALWRGDGRSTEPRWKRTPIAGRDFAMWTGVDTDAKWWSKQDPEKLSLYDVLFQFSPHADIRDKFHKQFAGRKDVPVLSWPGLLPGFYLGGTPDLSPGTPVRRWLEKTKSPFYIMTNYASGAYDDKTGPATHAALTGPLAAQFMGYIHGEALGTSGIGFPEQGTAKTRREFVALLAKHLKAKQAEAWSKIYKTKVSEDDWQRGISCLSVDSIALAHLFHDMGARVVGYEIDSTNVHAPMRIAFERGAARQYGGAWINYASGNFGDACNYFTQNPVVPRGAGSWFHSKYSCTDGVSAAWYRKLYYLNYLGGASAIYWEQSLQNQWILPGPGTHPIQLSPFGRATEDFQAFVDRLPDRGEPYAPIAFLLSHAHGYERVNYRCKMLHHFEEDMNDRELRELFNVAWHPSGVLEGQPAAPDVQSMPSGVYGNIFDVLVDRPERGKAIFNYPVVWAAGDVQLGKDWEPILSEYLKRGGTLVASLHGAKQLPEWMRGFRFREEMASHRMWFLSDLKPRFTAPIQVARIESNSADFREIVSCGDPAGRLEKIEPFITLNRAGGGTVICCLAPHLTGVDERAHPALPYLMNGLTRSLVPVEVLVGEGKKPAGEIMYQFNKTRDGWLVALLNQRGIDKTQTGIARVDRRAFVDVILRTRLAITSAREHTDPRALTVTGGEEKEVRLRVPAGDLQVVELITAR